MYEMKNVSPTVTHTIIRLPQLRKINAKSNIVLPMCMHIMYTAAVSNFTKKGGIVTVRYLLFVIADPDNVM